jgi:hypothetical protein
VSVEPGDKDTTIQPARCEIAGAIAYNVSHRIAKLGAHTTSVDFVLAVGAAKTQRARLALSYVGLQSTGTKAE